MRFILFLMCCVSLNAVASDLYSNDLCGVSSSKNRPCNYVKDLNFYFDGNLYGSENYAIYSKYLDNKIIEMNNVFSKFNVKVKLKPFPKGAWFNRPGKNDSNIELTFLFTETIDKKFIIINFYSFSKGPFNIVTNQCPSDDETCVVKAMEEIIDKNVIKPMLDNGN